MNGEPDTGEERSLWENDSHGGIINSNLYCLDMEQLFTCNERGLLDMLRHNIQKKSSGGTRIQRSLARDGMCKCRNSITLFKREWRGRILTEIFRVFFSAPEKHVLFATDLKIFVGDKSLEGCTFYKTGSEDVKMFRFHCIYLFPYLKP